jgi:hypothetical protein
MTNDVDQELQTYNTLLDLWQAENPIKTIKLQFLLATNAGLIGFLSLADDRAIFLAISGVLLNSIWTLSIGRTSLFQKAWKNKLDEIARRHPEDARFQILQIQSAEAKAPGWLKFLGGVSSKYYLLGAPIALALAWLVIAVNVPG